MAPTVMDDMSLGNVPGRVSRANMKPRVVDVGCRDEAILWYIQFEASA